MCARDGRLRMGADGFFGVLHFGLRMPNNSRSMCPSPHQDGTCCWGASCLLRAFFDGSRAFCELAKLCVSVQLRLWWLLHTDCQMAVSIQTWKAKGPPKRPRTIEVVALVDVILTQFLGCKGSVRFGHGPFLAEALACCLVRARKPAGELRAPLQVKKPKGPGFFAKAGGSKAHNLWSAPRQLREGIDFVLKNPQSAVGGDVWFRNLHHWRL